MQIFEKNFFWKIFEKIFFFKFLKNFFSLTDASRLTFTGVLSHFVNAHRARVAVVVRALVVVFVAVFARPSADAETLVVALEVDTSAAVATGRTYARRTLVHVDVAISARPALLAEAFVAVDPVVALGAVLTLVRRAVVDVNVAPRTAEPFFALAPRQSGV